MVWKLLLWAAFALLVSMGKAQVSPTPLTSLTPLPSESTSATPSPSIVDFLEISDVSPSPSFSSSASASATIPIGASITGSPSASSLASASALLTPSSSASVTPDPTSSATASASGSSTPSSSASVTPNPTSSATASATGSSTPSTSSSATVSLTTSMTATPSASNSISGTPSATPSASMSASATPTMSITVSPTISATVTATSSMSATPTSSASPSQSMVATLSPSPAPSNPPTDVIPMPTLEPLPASMRELLVDTELDGSTHNFNILANLMAESGLREDILGVSSGQMTIFMPNDGAFIRAARLISQQTESSGVARFSMRQSVSSDVAAEEAAMKVFTEFAKQGRMMDGKFIEGRLLLRALIAYHIIGGRMADFANFEEPRILISALNVPLYIAQVREFVDLSSETSNAGLTREAFIDSGIFTVHAMDNVLFPFPMAAPVC